MDPLTWENGRVQFLDQTRLPAELIVTDTDDPDLLVAAIRRLAVRGAPLIGIAGAYAAVLAARKGIGTPWRGVEDALNRIASARPTAVNLPLAIERIRNSVPDRVERIRPQDVARMEAEAIAIHQEDRVACDRIAEHGLTLFPRPFAALTHCNTGALATGGRGTAFGILRTAWERGLLQHLYIDETRPLFQGSRLTAWEAQELGIPSTLITDSTAAILLRNERVQAVVVGADRIARNGDVANKVGTYALAVLARAHGIPFFVAAPWTTVDPASRSGREMVVEERDPDEVRMVGGTSVAPAGIPVFAPAFDVTPAALITAVVTDRGVVRPPLQEGLLALAGTPVRT